MKKLLSLLVLTLCAQCALATNYYFSSVSGDDNRTAVQAQNPATPWQTLAKFNSIYALLQPGDSVFFKRGETFFGTADIRSSGVPGNVIYFGGYGSGAPPLFSGFSTLSGWTLQSAGIYYAPLDMTNLNMVLINGVAKGMGRYPNTGFLKYENNNANLSITDNELPASPNWTGGEIVMRKYRFILDRHTITNHAGTVLNYSTSTVNGSNAEFLPVKGNGYFIQNHLSTLDQFGEWYYDATAKRLYVFFGANAPAGYVVRASAKDYNVSVEGVSYVTLDELAFEGGNLKGLNVAFANNIIVQNCSFYNQGASALYGDHVSNIYVKGGSVNTSFSNGINFEHNADFCTVDGVSVFNSNMIPGTGRSGSGVSIGISVTGDNTTIINNKVINSGYSGIQFLGNNVLVEHNYVDTFCTIKDDGGGVYTFLGANVTTNSNRKIKNNVILNSIGAYAGAESYNYEPFGKGSGVYLDEHVNNVEISGNTIANGDWGGIFMHNIHDNVFTGNLVFNHRFQVLVSQYDTDGKNNTMSDNQYIAKQTSQYTFAWRSFFQDDPHSLGTFTNNYYARPLSDNNTIQLEKFWNNGGGTSYISLATWQSSFTQDAGSQKSPLTYASNIDDNLRFEYNETGVAKTVHLTANYVDVKNNQYAGDISLPPYSGVVLFKTAATFLKNQVITFPAIPTKTVGDPSFALAATSTSGLPVSYSLVSGPASVVGNTVTINGAGTVTIQATQAGDANYKPATPVSQSFTVLAATAQTISFDAIANKTFGDPAFALTASASSGLPVSFQVISGYATINGNMLTVTGAGIKTIIIEATQAGNGTFKAAPPVRRTFTVARANQTIAFGKLADKNFGDAPFTPTAAVASSGLPVTYKVQSGNATINNNLITLTGTGTVWLEASQSGDANYNGAPLVSGSFYVSKGGQTITFPAIPNKPVNTPPFNLAATASSGLPVVYQIKYGPATVSGSTVTLTGGTGEVLVEASQPGDANYNAAGLLSRTFVVTAAAKQSQTINFPAIPAKVYGTAPFAVSATASSGLPVTYSIGSGPATVSGNTVTITGVGTVTVKAAQAGNATYNAAPTVSQSFAVSKASQTINFGALANKTFGDAPFNISASATSGLAVAFKIASGPATLNGNTVTLTGPGTVTIEASQLGNSNYNAAPVVSQSFTVAPGGGGGKQSQTINFAALPGKTFGDAPFNLTATATSGLPVSYQVISGPVSIAGSTVTITGAGVVAIEASQAGDASYNPAPPVQQSFTVAKAAQTITFGTLANKTYGDPAFTVSASASSGLAITFKISSGPATISGNTVTLTGPGTVVVEASQPGNANFNAATPVTQSFNVASSGGVKQAQTITFGTLAYKTYTSPPFALTATSSSGLPISYKVVSGPISIAGNMVTITGVGSATIEASQTGDATYNAATPVSRSFTIGKAAQTITFGTLPNKVYGDAPFNLTATASSGLPVSYAVTSGPASVAGSTVTLTGVGTVTIQALQAGSVNYTAAPSLSRSFTVTAPPSVTVANRQPVMEEVKPQTDRLSVYPNPVRSQGYVQVQLTRATSGILAIYTNDGKLVKQLGYMRFEKGAAPVIKLDMQGLSQGSYYLRLITNKTVRSQRFQVM